VLLAVGEEDRVPARAGTRLNPPQNPGVERVSEVGHDDAYVAGLAGDEALGGGVRLVAELPGGGQDAIAGRSPHMVGRAQGARHRRRGDLGPTGDVVDGYRHRTAPAGLLLRYSATVCGASQSAGGGLRQPLSSNE